MSAVAPEAPPQVVELVPPSRGRSRYDNRITLQKLEVFCAVVELGGVSRAANHLWVAQSVVSGHLRSLQERLGVQVLVRDGQRMKLTRAGEQVYRWATETLLETRELMRRLDDIDEATEGTLALAASLSVGSYLLPPVLAEFRRDRPHATFAMSVSDPEVALAAVESGECDMAVVIAHAGLDHAHLACEVIGWEEIVLVVAAEDDSVGSDVLAASELAELPLVGAPAGTVARESVDRALADRGAPVQNVVMELGHPEAMRRVISSGAAAGLLFRSCVEDELARGVLKEIRFADVELRLPVIAAARTDRRPLGVQTQLVERARDRLATRSANPVEATEGRT